jgi:hypothetical protein
METFFAQTVDELPAKFPDCMQTALRKQLTLPIEPAPPGWNNAAL